MAVRRSPQHGGLALALRVGDLALVASSPRAMRAVVLPGGLFGRRELYAGAAVREYARDFVHAAARGGYARLLVFGEVMTWPHRYMERMVRADAARVAPLMQVDVRFYHQVRLSPGTRPGVDVAFTERGVTYRAHNRRVVV